MSKTAVAITSSDWHIRSSVPSSRAEKDWFEVMRKRMDQFRQLRERIGHVPILIAGDLFDRWNPNANLVTWCMEHLPDKLYAISGQHDTSGWRYESRMEGAYGALVKSHVITDIPHGDWVSIGGGLDVCGLPWGHYDLPASKPKGKLSVILLHKYVYATSDTAYTGVDTGACVTGITELADKANIVAIGDNHCKWRVSSFLNHGSLFSTTSAQKDHAHHLGILYSDGSYDWMRFPEESVEWVESPVNPEDPGADKFIQELKTLEVDAVCFREQLDSLAENLSENGKNSYKSLVESLDQR